MYSRLGLSCLLFSSSVVVIICNKEYPLNDIMIYPTWTLKSQLTFWCSHVAYHEWVNILWQQYKNILDLNDVKHDGQIATISNKKYIIPLKTQEYEYRAQLNIFLISLSWLLVNRIGYADVAQNSFLCKISLFIFSLCCCYILFSTILFQIKVIE